VEHLIILYDGVCGLCNRLVQFLLLHDKRDRLRFASLQSDFAIQILNRHGADPRDLDTVQVIEHYGTDNEIMLGRSDAVLRACLELGGVWKLGAVVGRCIPRLLRNAMYRFVAKNRYRVFGKYDTCLLPAPEHRAKFLDS
jgi:predicted DCC family thiol-disulfide oxidoreductase YuxK